MKTAKASLVVVLFVYVGSHPANADLTLYEPGLTPILRGSGFQSYPLAVDSSGDVFTVTGTSPSDQLLEITTSGRVLTLNSFVGGIIGTHGKLAFGFGGSLYATSGQFNSLEGIIQFSLPSGSGSFFYSGQQDGDAGMAYDPSRQVLWVSNSGSSGRDLIGLNSSGQVIETIPNVSDGAYGMALDKSGNLIVLHNTYGIIDSINPITQAVTQIADLSSVLPNIDSPSLALDPNNGDIYLTVNTQGGPSSLYRLNPDGTDLTLIASEVGLSQVAFGASSLGNGATSIYLGVPGSYQLYELQSVPEPSSLVIALTGALVMFRYGWRRSRRTRIAPARSVGRERVYSLSRQFSSGSCSLRLP